MVLVTMLNQPYFGWQTVMIAWLQRFSAYLSADDSALISSYLISDYLYLSPMSLSIQLTCPYVLTHGFHMDCSFVRSRCCFPSTLLVSRATDSCPLIRSHITYPLRLYTLFTYRFHCFMHCLLTLIVYSCCTHSFIGFMHGYGLVRVKGLEIEV